MTFFSKVFLDTYSNKNSMKNNWISSVSYWVCHAHLTNHWKCQLAKKRTFDTTYLELLWTYRRFILYPWANQKSCLFWGPVVHRRNGLPNMGPLKRLEKMNPKKVNRHFQWCVICNFAHVEKVNFFVVTDGCVQSANSPALQGDLMLFG